MKWSGSARGSITGFVLGLNSGQRESALEFCVLEQERGRGTNYGSPRAPPSHETLASSRIGIGLCFPLSSIVCAIETSQVLS